MPHFDLPSELRQSEPIGFSQNQLFTVVPILALNAKYFFFFSYDDASTNVSPANLCNATMEETSQSNTPEEWIDFLK